jgi:hypothetical protein
MKAFLHPNRIPAALPSAFLHDQDPKRTLGIALAYCWCITRRLWCAKKHSKLRAQKDRASKRSVRAHHAAKTRITRPSHSDAGML